MALPSRKKRRLPREFFCTPLDGTSGVPHRRGRMKQSTKVCMALILLLLGTSLAYAQTQYFQFGNLATTGVAISSTWTEISPSPAPRSFTTNATTDIEIVVNSWFSVGELTTARGVDFAVRLDGRATPFTNFGSVKASNSSAFLSILGY